MKYFIICEIDTPYDSLRYDLDMVHSLDDILDESTLMGRFLNQSDAEHVAIENSEAPDDLIIRDLKASARTSHTCGHIKAMLDVRPAG